MRYLVLLFGVLGLGGTGFVAYTWGMKWLEESETYEIERKNDEQNLIRLKTAGASYSGMTSVLAAEVKKINERGAKLYNYRRVLPFLLSGLVLGLLGIRISFAGHGFSGAALLLVSGAGPALFDWHVLIYTGSLILAGLFALFVRPPR